MTGITDSLWVVPAAYIVVAIVLGAFLVWWDESDPVMLSRPISASSASTALAALGSGMLAFTGFVTSVVLVIIQFGSSQFSPRLLRWFRHDRTLKFALSTFIATFLFALVSTAQVGRGESDFVPVRTMVAAFALTLLSVAMFLLLLDRTSNGLRVANVTQRLDAAAREVLDAVYPASASAAAEGEKEARGFGDHTPLQIVRNRDVGSVLVTLEHEVLVRLAARADAVIEVVHAVGDHVPATAPLLKVYGTQMIPERRLRRGVVLGDERTAEHDPAFVIRMLVDIAIRALSPAVNDPTTAVQSLHRIEDVLRYAAGKHLAIGSVSDHGGVTRLVYPTATWDDLVELALDEIRLFGAGQYQIARRVRAMLDDLLADLPDHRQPALLLQRALLDDAVDARFRPRQRDDALVADRQGLGMGRRS